MWGLVAVVVLALSYAAGYRRGLIVGALRATRRQVVRLDGTLSRWRREEPGP